MFRTPSRFLRAVNARFLGDSGPVRAMSLLHPLALHDGEGGAGGGGGAGSGGGAGGGAGKGKGGEGGGGEGGGEGGADDLPIEQQLGAVKGKNRELLGKLARNKPFVDFAKTLGITDIAKISAEQLDRLKGALAEDGGAGAGSGKGDEKLNARIAALQKGFDTEKAALTERTTVLSTALDKALRRSAAGDAITAEGGNAKLLSSIVDQHVKLIEDEEKPGEFSVVVVDEKGNPRYTKGGKEMTPREFVAELKASGDYDGAFAAPKSSGGGSKSGASANGRTSGSTDLVLSRDDAQDPAKYRAARARAEKEGLTLKIAS
jgi:hypothetical protein